MFMLWQNNVKVDILGFVSKLLKAVYLIMRSFLAKIVEMFGDFIIISKLVMEILELPFIVLTISILNVNTVMCMSTVNWMLCRGAY